MIMSGGLLREWRCKPDFVSALRRTCPPQADDDHSSGTAVTGRLERPTRRLGRATLERRPIWPCSVRGLPSRGGRPPRWWALTPPFHPCSPEVSGLLSVALSVGSRPLGVTQRTALWSPDFPPRSLKAAAIIPSTPAPKPSACRHQRQAAPSASVLRACGRPPSDGTICPRILNTITVGRRGQGWIG
jgi:hypothetical protein